MNNYKHWNIEQDAEHIIWLGIDRKDAAVNTIHDEVLDELNTILQDIVKRDNVNGLILHSLKKKGFIAGADVKVFAELTDAEKVGQFLTKGQTVFTRLESLPFPTVAMIDGFCMGGGLELALACDYRIASNHKDTRLGLPEVLLGIHPGWGGTVRLPKLIGGFDALSKVMLTGQAIAAKRAKQIGFVDEVVALRQLKRAAIYYILNKPPKHRPSFLQSLSNNRWIRSFLANQIKRNVNKKVSQSHYPAPFAILSLWEKSFGDNEHGMLKEVDSIRKLVTQNDTSRNLIRVFHLRERLKAFGKDLDFKAQHVHVIGAGIMGGDIAAWCALRDIRVTLQDQSFERIAPAIERAHQLFKKKLRDPRLIKAAQDRLLPDPDGHGVSRADVIIEAVFENLALKQSIMKSVEVRAKSSAIIATNTSSIPLDEINQAMQDPARLVGIHFFNPVAMMELVEVVCSQKTSKATLHAACSFVGQIARLPLPVQSSPGFLVNRVLMPYLMECVQLLEEGYAPEKIDNAARQFGMMMGPVELADTVGMDVCLAVAKNLTAHFGGDIPKKLTDLVEAGKLGRKTGEGFYRYVKGKPVKKTAPSQEKEKHSEIANRLMIRMVNEAAACLREGVVADADLLDAGMIFGSGFAPFRGGPMNYIKHFDNEQLNQVLSQLEARHGERFKTKISDYLLN
jgi:3-hydroxyacyl-CoA dehydrogenase/enoyl-CoA hydratase/3-hydroxybutyryl-CoA epimerase